MPDVKFANKADIPEELQKDAKEVDGKFVVNLVLNSELKVFRDNNIKFRDQRDAFEAELAPFKALGIEDPVKFKSELPALRQTAQQVADGKLQGTEAIAKEVAKRVEAANKDTADRIAALETSNTAHKGRADEWEGKFRSTSLANQFAELARHKDSPVNPEAIADIIARAERDGWRTDDNGKPIKIGADGKPAYSVKDPTAQMEPMEWLGNVVKSAPYLGKQSGGGGAGGGRRGAGGGDYFQSEEFLKLPEAEQVARFREAQGSR